VDRLESLEGKGFTLKLRKSIRKINEARLDSPEPIVSGGSVNSDLSRREYELKRLAASSPPSAIVESWLIVEESAKQLAERINSDALHDKKSPHAIEKWLQASELISPQAASVITELRILRNLSVHARPVERERIRYDDAVRAIEAALAISETLDNISQ
tara:strand:- start:1587 stop:2063 length:477 start_codon:yes stop_codon:yes gene_type:complete